MLATVTLPFDSVPTIRPSEKERLTDEAGARSIRPSFPRLRVAELVPVVATLPSEKNVLPLNDCSPFTKTKGFSPPSRGPVTVISAEPTLFASDVDAIIVWIPRSESMRVKTIERENSRDTFELFMCVSPPWAGDFG
jgi:hypothetical protein